MSDFDPVTLEILWSRLIAITDESAAALMRTSFSTIVRESNVQTQRAGASTRFRWSPKFDARTATVEDRRAGPRCSPSPGPIAYI